MSFCAVGGSHLLVMGTSPSAQTQPKRRPGVGTTRSEAGAPRWSGLHSPSPEFCFRNSISRPTYHRLRSEGRGPVEMRIGLNLIRITLAAERDWQRQMQEPREDLEARAVERAVKAGGAAVKSSKHISKKRAARRGRQSPTKNEPAPVTSITEAGNRDTPCQRPRFARCLENGAAMTSTRTEDPP